MCKCIGKLTKNKMTWCNDSDENRVIESITPRITITPNTDDKKLTQEIRTTACPSCGHNIAFKDKVLIILSVNILFYNLKFIKNILFALILFL